MLPVWLTDTVTPDLDRAVHYTLLWGLQGVELRTVGGAAERVPRVNEEKVQRRLAESELLPAAVVPGLFEAPLSDRARWMNGLATFGETIRFCERIGCPRVVVSAFERAQGPVEGAAEDLLEEAAGALRRAAEKAAPAGLTLAVLNEADGTCPTGAALAHLLGAVGHPAVQAAWSPATALAAGEDPAEGLRALGERVTLVRCADGAWEGGAWQQAPFGDGAVGWEEQVRRLRAQDFRGPLSLEIDLEPRPRQGLRAATRLVQMIRAARREGD